MGARTDPVPIKTIPVRILGYKRSQRYSMARALMAVQRSFKKAHPEVQIDVWEVTTAAEMLQFTSVFVFPSLMIQEKRVCVGMFPGKEEILGWLQSEIEDTKSLDQ